MRAIACGILWFLLFPASFTSTLVSSNGGIVHVNATSSSSKNAMMIPLGETKTMMFFNESRRKLNSFEICSLCTCCGGEDKSYCLPSPCCYAINCNIPNRPFGFCSFTPKTCNCFDCHI